MEICCGRIGDGVPIVVDVEHAVGDAFWRRVRNRQAGEPGTQLCWLDHLGEIRSNRGDIIPTREYRTWVIEKIRGIRHMSNALYAFNWSSQTEQAIIMSDKHAVTIFNHGAYGLYALIDHGCMNASGREFCATDPQTGTREQRSA